MDPPVSDVTFFGSKEIRWVFMVFHGSRLVFHGSRWVFHGSRWVFMVSWFKVGFSWFQVGFDGSRLVFMVQGWFFIFHIETILELYSGPTNQSRPCRP